MHHAHLLIGTKEAARAHLETLFGKLAGSPDFFVFAEPALGIDEARKLSESAGRRAFAPRTGSGQAGRKIFFIAPEKITREAQNALLKTFEEPIPDTHFFLVARDEASVLPTLRSRCELVRLEREEVLGSEAKRFLSLAVPERIAFAKKFADDDLPAGRQGQGLPQFLDELLSLTRDRRVFAARLISTDRGAAPRLILEHLALVL